MGREEPTKRGGVLDSWPFYTLLTLTSGMVHGHRVW